MAANGNTGSGSAQGQAIFYAQPRRNYAGHYPAGEANLECYTPRQMKSLYPSGAYEKVGEYAPGKGGGPAGVLRSGAAELPLSRYGAHSRVTHREKGWVAVGADSFAALLTNVLVPRALIAALVLVLIAGGVLLAPGVAGPPGTAAVDLEEGAVPWQGVQNQDTGGTQEGIAIPGYKSITVGAGRTNVQVNFQNPEGNPCYFRISLRLDDGTVLYQSKMIRPGMALYDIALTKPLRTGEYGATVRYETFSLSDLSPMNGADVRITLIAR
jgi:hypothetical protein